MVAHRHGARFLHLADLRELLALFAHGDGTDRTHFRQIYLFGTLDDIAHDRRVIADGRSVRHTADLRKTAPDRRRAAAGNILFILETGFAQMHVHIDERGKDV